MRIKQDSPDFSFYIMENERNRFNLQTIAYNSKYKRLKSKGYIGTLLDLHSLMSNSLEIIAPCTQLECNEEGIPIYDSNGIWFSPDFPNFLLPKTNSLYKDSPGVIPNLITWGVVREEPGTLDDRPFRGTQEIVPRHREYIAILADTDSQWVVGDDIQGYGRKIQILNAQAQVFDNLVQYNIWSKSNYEVERLVEWFREYMRIYRGMFREAGVVNLYFDRRIRDDTLIAMNFGYHVRSVLYYFRTERVNFLTTDPIRKINLNVSVNDLQATISKADNRSIDSSLRQIMEKWINKNNFGGNLNG